MAEAMSKTNKLSLCMIIKNESAYVREAVESVLPIVEECIVIDSGSTDESTQIIQDLAKLEPKIRFFHREWPNDFSKQKNFAIDQAKFDWILFLDADERIYSEDHSQILEAIQNRDIFAYDLPIRNYTNEVTEIGFIALTNNPIANGFIPTHLHRLFRRDLRIRYEGILHERIEQSLQKFGLKTQPLSATIHHLGPLKEGDPKTRATRYIFYEDLGRKKIAAEPLNPQAHWELGVVLQKQKKLDEASREFERAHSLSPATEEFETYYCLSLFQQCKWSRLIAHPVKSNSAKAFQLLAQAQTNPSAIDDLDRHRRDFSQMALFIFELSLNHKRTDRLASDRALAMEAFGKTGLVEFLEGSALRKQGELNSARELLLQSQKKGCALAERELQFI